MFGKRQGRALLFHFRLQQLQPFWDLQLPIPITGIVSN